jgi:hypothetical protein
MKINESYDELRKQINLYLDNELEQENYSKLMTRIESDPVCCSMLNVEKDFREYIRTNFKRPPLSADLEKNIKARLEIEH